MTDRLREIDAAREGFLFLLDHIFAPGVECRGVAEPCDRSACRKLDALHRYLRRNLAREEALMRAAGYPDLDGHRRDHAALLARLAGLRDGGVCGDRCGAMLSGLLRSWILGHGDEHDRAYGGFATIRDGLRAAC